MASIQFCVNCNNMLYPQEDRAARQLHFACKHCGHSEKAEGDQQCVFRNVIVQTAIDQTIGHVDLGSDPTFPRIYKTCPNCGHDEAVFFQSKAKGPDTTLQLYFACCNQACMHRWTDAQDRK